jgi:hypothetical protein
VSGKVREQGDCSEGGELGGRYREAITIKKGIELMNGTDSAKIYLSVAFAFALAGCAGQAAATPTAANPPSATGLSRPDAGVQVYTADRDNPGVFAFPNTANGNVAPTTSIAGKNTQLVHPNALALGPNGNIYVANDGATVVQAFGPNQNGNVKPKRTIGGSKSQLGPTEGLFVDSKGDLFVSNYSGNAVTEYAPGAKGNVAPINTIGGNETLLDYPVGMAVDQKGRLWVANMNSSSIVAFASGASGNVAPVVTVSGSNTGLEMPFSIAFDSKGRLLVADEGTSVHGLLVFAKGASGNVTPVQHILVPSQAAGVTADAQDRIWAVDSGVGAILEYAKNANGAAKPLREIAGSKTGLKTPCYVFLH